MNRGMRKLVFVAIFISTIAKAQNAYVGGSFELLDQEAKVYFNWYNKDPKNDKIQGLATEKAYKELLVDKKPSRVVVAVIDGGVDINHEDLKGNIWVNEDEIPGNGIDDDNNGYVDDVHGWNFLGNGQGENIEYEQLEITRLYKRSLQEGSSENANNKEGIRISYLDELKKAEQELIMLKQFEVQYSLADSIMTDYFGTHDYSHEDVHHLKAKKNTSLHFAKKFLTLIYKNGFTAESMRDYTESSKDKVKYHLNTDYSARDIIGDNPQDYSDRNYGNPDVVGKEPDHGTFVAGIIAAGRNNGIGIDGISANALIMPVRAVPNGDERDKDIANAIYYAVDNGAQIINMSFGKAYSPGREYVLKAISYAEEKGVLMVHAAGNDGTSNDVVRQYPTCKKEDGSCRNSCWIEVGASSFKSNREFVGNFSNYGKESVDLFAPGVNIYSLKPGNLYELGDGTSFAAPMVSGVAALVMSYNPKLSAPEVKEIVLKSVQDKSKLKVNKPGEGKKKVRFEELCKTGGLVNAYEALKLASTY